MYFSFKNIIYAISFILIFHACESENTIIDPVIVENNKYYNAEIFPDELQRIYGIWELKAISGGITGEGYSPDFDYMEIQEIGIFKIYGADSLLTFGQIIIEEVSADEISIIFKEEEEEEEGSHSAFYDAEKYVDLRTDTLNLFAPCCDRYNYHFIRSKKRG